MFRVLCAAALLALGGCATPPAPTVSTYSPPMPRIEAMCEQGDRSACVLMSQDAAEPRQAPRYYGPPPSYYRSAEPVFVPMGDRYVPPALQTPQRVIVQQMPRLQQTPLTPYPPSKPYQAVAY